MLKRSQMNNIYTVAWRLLQKRIAASRRQTIARRELERWQLEALQKAIEVVSGEQEAAQKKEVL